MLTIFQFFATKTDASKLRMLSGSPKERLLQPIIDYIEARGGKFHIRWGCRCCVNRCREASAAMCMSMLACARSQCVITESFPSIDDWTLSETSATLWREAIKRTAEGGGEGLKFDVLAII